MMTLVVDALTVNEPLPTRAISLLALCARDLAARRSEFASRTAGAERLSDVTIQPIIFTLLFLYVFGSAIHIPGVRYQDYLLPGLLGQSLAFGVIGTGTATVTDFTTGVIDRFRSLPVTRLSVITAQVVGQIIEQVLGIAIVVVVGLGLGWRPHLSFTSGLELAGLMMLGLLAFSWFGVLMGMLVRNSGRYARTWICHRVPPLLPGRHIRAHRGDEGCSPRDWRVGPALGPGRCRSPDLPGDSL